MSALEDTREVRGRSLKIGLRDSLGILPTNNQQEGFNLAMTEVETNVNENIETCLHRRGVTLRGALTEGNILKVKESDG